MKILIPLIAGLALAGTARANDADGEVRKVDKAQSKITLKHGEIKKLDMPPMTMVFRVRDAKLLDGVAAGDKVTFSAEQIDGNYVVTALQKKP
jgi:Cu(I)/Ag(I) efflux system periplasmic protein CusF